MGKTCIALLGNIPAHQNEIISLTILQSQMVIPDVAVIDFYENNKMLKLLDGEANILKAEQWNYNCWSDIYKHYKDILVDFDNVIIFKAPTMRGYKNISDIEMLKEIKLCVKDDDTYNMQYDLMKRNIERILFAVAARDKNVIHICIDNQEVDFSEVWKFKSYKRICKVYSDTKQNETIGPIFEYAMVQTYIQEIPKAQNLYYIASMATSDRRYLGGIVDEVNRRLGKREKGGYGRVVNVEKKWTNPTSGTCLLFDKNELKNNRVSQTDYYYNLMLSKYTIISPPYDKDVFNMVRFIEAVICDCVPIVLPECNMSNLRLTYPDFYDIIYKRDLVESAEHIHRRIRNYDIDKKALSDIRRTASYYKMTDLSYIKKFYNKILK